MPRRNKWIFLALIPLLVFSFFATNVFEKELLPKESSDDLSEKIVQVYLPELINHGESGDN